MADSQILSMERAIVPLVLPKARHIGRRLNSNLFAIFGPRVFFIQHALHVSSLGLSLLSPFSWAMKMVTTKANQEMTCARHAG